MSAQILDNNSFCNNSEVPECPSDNESVSSNKLFLPQQKVHSNAPATEAYILLNNSSISEIPKQDQDRKSSKQNKQPVASKILNTLQKMTTRIVHIAKLYLKKEQKKSTLRVSFELIGLQLVKKMFQTIKNDTNKQEVALYKELADVINSIDKLKEINNNFILSGSAYQKDFLVYGRVNQLINPRDVNSQSGKGPFTFAKLEIAPKQSFLRDNTLEFPLVSGLKVAETATIFPTSLKGAVQRGFSTIYLSPLFPLVQLNFDKFTIYRPGDAIFVFGKKLTNTSFLATTLFKDFNLSPFYKAANKLSIKQTFFQVLVTATAACIGIKIAIMIKRSFEDWVNELEKDESNKQSGKIKRIHLISAQKPIKKD